MIFRSGTITKPLVMTFLVCFTFTSDAHLFFEPKQIITKYPSIVLYLLFMVPSNEKQSLALTPLKFKGQTFGKMKLGFWSDQKYMSSLNSIIK